VTGELWGCMTAQWDCVAVGWVSQCCEKFPDGDVRTAAGLLIDSAQLRRQRMPLSFGSHLFFNRKEEWSAVISSGRLVVFLGGQQSAKVVLPPLAPAELSKVIAGWAWLSSLTSCAPTQHLLQLRSFFPWSVRQYLLCPLRCSRSAEMVYLEYLE